MSVIVLIPIYKEKLNEFEKKSLIQCVNILNKHKIQLVAPNGLDVTDYCNVQSELSTIFFDKKYFKSTKTYSQLLLSPRFYKRFVKYEYMLIHQLDAYVFNDELNDWCEKGFDYIGAPWYNEEWPQQKYLSYLESNNLFKRCFLRKVDFNRGDKLYVGNGGLSLRKVKKFLWISRILKLFKGDFNYIDGLNEDVIWSIYVTKYFKSFKVAKVEDAIAFSFEKCPEKLFALNNECLPFGCHAWEKHNLNFWKKFIPL